MPDINSYNQSSAYHDSEKAAGIETLTAYNGFTAWQKALCHGTRGTIRRFVRYPSGRVNVDFLPEGNTYTGIETDADDLAHIEPGAEVTNA